MKPTLQSIRTSILTATLLFTSFITAFAQLTGTFTIDPAGSGSTNFTTFAAALATLNPQGVGAGGVVVAMYVFRHAYKLEHYITNRHFDKMVMT